jgi:hypothetical protein
MIDRILMELYDDYEKNNLDSLIEFANKTFPNDGTSIFFAGCVLILFSRAGGYKARYEATREKLYDIVLAAKEKTAGTNLLLFYVDRMNTQKGIKKYFDNLDKEQIEKYADLVIEYLDQFKPKFIYSIKNKIIN